MAAESDPGSAPADAPATVAVVLTGAAARGPWRWRSSDRSGWPGSRGDLRAVQDPDRGGTRAALGVLGAGLAVSAWIGLPVLAIMGLRLPAVSQPGYEAVVPPTWSAVVDPTTGSTRFVTVAEDVLVIIRPAASPGAEGLGDMILVGAREADLVDVTQEGEVRWLTYELVDGADAYWVTVAGTGQAIANRQDELRQLLDAVQWRTDALADN